MALLFVYGESGSVGDVAFNDWYDNEHAPLRLTVPGIHTAIRYKAIDGQTPTWLAIYDLSSAEVSTSAAYTSLGKNASDRERALIPQLDMLHRRIYEAKEPLNVVRPAAKYLVISIRHNDDHDQTSTRSRQFTLVSSVELTGKGEDQPTPRELIIHDYDSPPTSVDETQRVFALHREFT